MEFLVYHKTTFELNHNIRRFRLSYENKAAIKKCKKPRDSKKLASCSPEGGICLPIASGLSHDCMSHEFSNALLKTWFKHSEYLNIFSASNILNIFYLPPTQFSRFHATHIKMSDSTTQVKAMDSVRKAISSVFSKEAFPYTRFYVGWETDKVILNTFVLGQNFLLNVLSSGRSSLAGLPDGKK